MCNIVGYHATSKANAISIVNRNFKVPEKPEDENDKLAMERYTTYWLGPGVYFFKDIEAATWWKNKPSSRFGVEGSVESKTIIKATISTSDDTWDLREVSRLKEFDREFHEYMSAAKELMNSYSGCPKEELLKKIRCAFFAWLCQKYNIHVIIANFSLNDYQYLDPTIFDAFGVLSICYTEVQICVYNINCIKNIVNLEEG